MMLFNLLLFAACAGGGSFEADGVQVQVPSGLKCMVSPQLYAVDAGFTTISSVPVVSGEGVHEVACEADGAWGEPSYSAGMLTDLREKDPEARLDRLLNIEDSSVSGPAQRTKPSEGGVVEVQEFKSEQSNLRRLLHLTVHDDHLHYLAYAAHPDKYDEAAAEKWFATVKFHP